QANPLLSTFVFQAPSIAATSSSSSSSTLSHITNTKNNNTTTTTPPSPQPQPQPQINPTKDSHNVIPPARSSLRRRQQGPVNLPYADPQLAHHHQAQQRRALQGRPAVGRRL